jgi:bifunctional UDP-N-acetylglucosamine pyrophosphorylase/glucosamine-1-phosphate N-acetyltransferase
VPDDALAIGRVRQVNKPGYASKLRERLLAAKNAK